MFLKLKQESSGFPPWVQSEDDKDRYIEDYRRTEGIALDKASISKNSGQRTSAKLKLNSMWGNWAQNQNKTQTTIVVSKKEFYELLKVRVLRSLTSFSRTMKWYGYLGNFLRIT